MKFRRLLATGAALTLGLAACSSDDDSPEAADAQEVNQGEGTEASIVEVVAVDFSFEGLPDSVPAGTRLRLRNDASSELHELVAFKLDDEESRSIDEIVALPPEEMQATLGEPTTVLLAPPSSEQVAAPIGDGTLEEPGRYAIICVIPTGVDPDEYLAAAATSNGPPDVGGGAPHIAHGMYAELTVD